MATRLGLYNEALSLLGEREISSLTENREPRRLLDSVWDRGAVRYILEQGLWNFATRAVKITYSPSVEPPFGFTYAFDKPTDFVRLAAIASDEYFTCPLTHYEDERDFWFADLKEIYVRYVSDDEEYGGDLSLWPETVTRWAACWMATQICERLTQGASKLEQLEKRAKALLVDARSKDVMNEPARFAPQGSWASSRHRGLISRDRGHRTSLY